MKSLVQKTDEAQELVRELVEMQEFTRRLDVARGRLLWQLKSNNLYKKAFGEGVDTWHEFLRSPEIALSVSESNRLMQLYEYFVLKLGFTESELADVPIKSLNHMLPKLKSGELGEDDITELVDSARALTFHQFKERLYDVQHNDLDSRTYTYLIMRKCNETGNLSRIQHIPSEDIVKAFPTVENA